MRAQKWHSTLAMIKSMNLKLQLRNELHWTGNQQTNHSTIGLPSFKIHSNHVLHPAVAIYVLRLIVAFMPPFCTGFSPAALPFSTHP